MNEQQRLAAFKQTLSAASAQYGISIAIVQQIGNVVLDEPALGYVFVTEPIAAAADDQKSRPLSDGDNL